MTSISLIGIALAIASVFFAYHNGYASGYEDGRGEGYGDGKRDGSREGSMRGYAVGFDRGRRQQDDPGDDAIEGGGMRSQMLVIAVAMILVAMFVYLMTHSGGTPKTASESTHQLEPMSGTRTASTPSRGMSFSPMPRSAKPAPRDEPSID